MIKLLVRKFVPDYKNTSDRKVREHYSILAGILGIICNAFLFALKLFIGIFVGSISIMSDAFNNLSDMGSSLVAIIGARLSNKKPDRDHPYGHGRFEYISSLIVAGIILMVGVELLTSSFDKVLHPEVVEFQLVPMIILALSLLVKVWMFAYNRYLGREINSSILRATASDSINDVISTSVVIVATVVGSLFKIPLDGYLGVLVSLWIMLAGFKIGKEVVGDLLGRPPEPEMVAAIERHVLSAEGVVGVHDLMVHNYGPGRMFASVHAEVPDDADIVEAHEHIDAAEAKVYHELGVVLVIHMDPISVRSEHVRELRELAQGVIDEVGTVISMHDFRITEGDSHINLIFDIVVPVETKTEVRTQIVSDIKRKIHERDNRLYCVIQVDNDLTSR